jgi:arylsulfatase A-like enzyme
MHYAAWLEDQGIPPRPPYFMTRDEARATIGEVGMPGSYDTRDNDGAALPPTTWALPERYHSSTWVADETIAFLEGHVAGSDDRPFFLSVNFPDPHPPFTAPEPWDRMYEDVELPAPIRRIGEWEQEGKPEFYRATLERRVAEAGWHTRFKSIGPLGLLTPTAERMPVEDRWWRTYLGMQSLVDKHLGRILETVDRLGLAGDTLVIATSDHGELMGDHFLWHKGGLHYDGGARVPLIVRWPGHVPAGTRSSSLQSLVDLAPTIMSAAGIEPDPAMQGVDQLPAWEDPETTRRDGLLIEHPIESGLRSHSWITDRHRLSIYSDLAHNRTEFELYDLQEDPGEFDSLSVDPGSQRLVNDLTGEAFRHMVKLQLPWAERISRA